MSNVTKETYNKAAKAYAEKFAGIGPRIIDIDRVFKVWGKENPRVLELGCGDGRDAIDICKRTNKYIGIDNSSEMIKIAKEKAPDTSFLIADIRKFPFEEEVDIIFAFASMLHLDKQDFESVLKRAENTLSKEGIFYLSLKKGEYIGSEIVSDDFGDRIFYYYQENDIKELSNGYQIIFSEKQTRGHTEWIDLMLKKI